MGKKGLVYISIGLVLGVALSYSWFSFSLSDKKLVSDPLSADILIGKPGYVYQNNLLCQIIYSSNSTEINKKISLLNLNTTNPRVLFENGVDSPMKKIYESNNLLSIQLVAGTGGVDTVILEKATGVFSRVTAGSLAGTYAIAYRGNCN